MSKKPILTVIIPIYNTGDAICPVIRSIQNQDMQDIEIIIVNDFSSDYNHTLKLLEKFKEKDPRISIINNKKNMGILYSRSIGVLQSKGKYIMNLDHDDLIFDGDVFDTSYKSAKNGDFDIISFMYVISINNDSEIKEIRPCYIPHNSIILQPELSVYTMFKNDEFQYFDYTIWAKIYKNIIYKKAINLLTFERYSVFNTYNEDLIGLFAICNVANSYKYIRKYGVYHREYNKSTSYTTKIENRIFYDIFFSEIIFDLAKNQFKKYSAIFLEKRVNYSNKENNK